jgi:hypothetical protein
VETPPKAAAKGTPKWMHFHCHIHIVSDNLVLLAVLLESEQVVALMAVNCEQAVGANYPLLCMLIKVLQPLQTKLICCPAVLRDCNNPILE